MRMRWFTIQDGDEANWPSRQHRGVGGRLHCSYGVRDGTIRKVISILRVSVRVVERLVCGV